MGTTATTYNTTSTLQAAFATVVITASIVSWSVPAFAAPPVRDATSPTATSASYASPLDALGGQTLAQYLADHQAGNTRLQ